MSSYELSSIYGGLPRVTRPPPRDRTMPLLLLAAGSLLAVAVTFVVYLVIQTSRSSSSSSAPSLSPLLCKPPLQADFFVSPLGNDSWSGTIAEPPSSSSSPTSALVQGPFLTIDRARLAVRALLAKRNTSSATVAIRAGTYYLSSPLLFSPLDSGSERAPVCYVAYENEQPVISGGREIKRFATDDKVCVYLCAYAFGWDNEESSKSVVIRMEDGEWKQTEKDRICASVCPHFSLSL